MARSSGSLPSLKVSTPVTSHNGFQRMHLGNMLAVAGTEGGASHRLMGVHYQQTPSSRQLFTSTAVCTCCFTCFQPSSNLVVVVRGNTGGQQGPLAPLTTACVRAAGQIRERTASDPATKWVSREGPVLFVSSPLVGLLSVGAFFRAQREVLRSTSTTLRRTLLSPRSVECFVSPYRTDDSAAATATDTTVAV